MRFVDSPVGLSWIHPEPAWMQRAGHAVVAGGGVWLIDPPDGDGLRERLEGLGTVRGVVQLLDRHDRDGAALAEHFGVDLHVVPSGQVAGAPFEVVGIWRLPLWKEVALWFPGRRVLAVAEALCGESGYTAPGERVGVHPMRRLLPPSGLMRFDAEHLLLGHGEPVFGEPAVRAALDDAVHDSIKRIPSLLAAQARLFATGRGLPR